MPRRHLSADEQAKLDEVLRSCWRRKVALSVIVAGVIITILLGI